MQEMLNKPAEKVMTIGDDDNSQLESSREPKAIFLLEQHMDIKFWSEFYTG